MCDGGYYSTLSISCVLTCGRCVLLMVWRLSSRVPCARSGFSPCCILSATLDRNVRAVLYALVVVFRS